MLSIGNTLVRKTEVPVAVRNTLMFSGRNDIL